MTKKICCYCDEEKPREELLYSRSLGDYVCDDCRQAMTSRNEYSYKEDEDASL